MKRGYIQKRDIYRKETDTERGYTWKKDIQKKRYI